MADLPKNKVLIGGGGNVAFVAEAPALKKQEGGEIVARVAGHLIPPPEVNQPALCKMGKRSNLSK